MGDPGHRSTTFSLVGSTGNAPYTSGGWIGDGGFGIPGSLASPNQCLWKRIPESTRTIPITHFGALASAPVTYGAIVVALTYLEANGGGTLLFPPRATSYEVDPPIVSGLTVTVDASDSTFTRSSGSFLTDGFQVGLKVSWRGFANAANNVHGAEITALTATVMEVNDQDITDLEDENNVAGVAASVPIDLAFDNLSVELAPGAILKNVSADGVDFFAFTGPGPNRQRVNFCGGTITSDNDAGHVFTFANQVGIGQCSWTSEINQQNPDKSILYRGASAEGGWFSNVFAGPHWSHGTEDDPGEDTAPRVPAVFVQAPANIFNTNQFVMQRVSCHQSQVPFFWLVNDTDSGAYWTRNKIDIGHVEASSFGFIYAAGHLGLSIGRLGFYDLDGTYGHLIETATGSGTPGRVNEQCLFNDIEVISVTVSGGLSVGGVRGPRRSATITAAATTATLTSTPGPHGYNVGDTIFVRGANEAAYNGRFSIVTVPSSTTLTYTMGSSPASPATGTITFAKSTERSATIASAGTTATLTASSHTFAVGQRIFVEGANESAYNGRFTIVTVPDTNTLTYEMASDPNDTATGTITVAEAAMTIKIGSGDFRHTLGHIGGNSDSSVEVDVNSRSALVSVEQSRCLYARVSPTLTNRSLIGTGARFDTPLLSNLTLGGIELTTGIISPSSLSADQNNWAPTGITTARVVRVAAASGDSTCNITGISAGQEEGRRLTLINLGTDALVLKNQVTSSVANRFILPGGDMTIPVNGAVELIYDGTALRWRATAKSL